MQLLPRLFTLLVLSSAAVAQINSVPLSISPLTKIEQSVGISKFTIQYSSPGVKNRKVFGDLEPFGRIWRTGANASTKVTSTHDFTFGDVRVEAGTYALYSIPDKKAWTLILSRDTALWGTAGYDPKNDAARVQVQPIKLKDSHESLTIALQRFQADRAELYIQWDKTKVVVPIVFDTEKQMLASIDERVRSAKGKVNPAELYGAGMYMYDRFQTTGSKEALAEALTWVGQAADANPNAYWQMYFKAEIALAAGDHPMAKTAANQALKKAKAAGANDFGYTAKIKLLLKGIQ
ncbi:MAG: DUF2911 domain-containing protein [Planctomycetota bacterium]|nr:DUF2911 domain-containing protein [Planctomycetota bacterium]